MNEKIDAFIPCSPKDATKLKYAVQQLVKHFKDLNNIHVCVPDKSKF